MGYLGPLELLFIIIVLGYFLLQLVALGKIFEKAGRPMWQGLIPIYNYFKLFQIVGRPAWWGLLIFPVGAIPVVGELILVITILILMIELAKAFGKSTLYGIGLFLFGPIMLPVLAFGKAQYQGPLEA